MARLLFPETKLSVIKDKNGNYLGDLAEVDSDSLLIPKAKVQELSRKDNNGTNEWFNGNGLLNTEATPEDVQAAIDGAVSISGVFISESNTFNTDNHIEDGAIILDEPKIITTNSLLNLESKINTLNKLVVDINNICTEINLIKVLLYNIQHGTAYTSIDEIELNGQNN